MLSVRPGAGRQLAGAFELAMVLVVRKKDDHNKKKTSHLILEMSMDEAFIWLSGHRFIDREIFNG